MFDSIDDVLRRLLIQEIPIRGNEIEIAFDQPRREWSARLNRPTLNIFLHDVRENVKQRSAVQRQSMDPIRGDITIRRPEVRLDLHYMITAWASESDDEHRLLARTLISLLRNPELPDSLLPEVLRDQPRPISLSVAQYDHMLNPSEIWGVLNNEMRPSMTCVVTLTVDPHLPLLVPPVRTRELRLAALDVQSEREQSVPSQSAPASNGTPALYSRDRTIGGMVRIDVPLESVRLTLVELAQEVPIDANGRFVIGNLREGDYTFRLEIADQDPISHVIHVPSRTYDIDAKRDSKEPPSPQS